MGTLCSRKLWLAFFLSEQNKFSYKLKKTKLLCPTVCPIYKCIEYNDFPASQGTILEFQGKNSLVILQEGHFENGLMRVWNQCKALKLVPLSFIFNQVSICIWMPEATSYLRILEVAFKISTNKPYHWPTQSPCRLRSALSSESFCSVK